MAKMGRPTKYDDDLIDEICTRVSNGTPLREICREEGKPAWTTFYNWINADKELFERFARARELGTDAIAEDTLAIMREEGAEAVWPGWNLVPRLAEWEQSREPLVEVRQDPGREPGVEFPLSGVVVPVGP